VSDTTLFSQVHTDGENNDMIENGNQLVLVGVEIAEEVRAGDAGD